MFDALIICVLTAKRPIFLSQKQRNRLFVLYTRGRQSWNIHLADVQVIWHIPGGKQQD
ncbi:hypothetical protein CHCC20335_1348 [Bacillus paralicheniformis]|nr:hypothetical protein CHCC20335_1348 [Bacillus paralicheniformis]